jgi:hypothetical protein
VILYSVFSNKRTGFQPEMGIGFAASHMKQWDGKIPDEWWLSRKDVGKHPEQGNCYFLNC